MNSSNKLLTNAVSMARGRSASTYSANRFSIHKSLRQSSTLKVGTNDIPSFLQQMERYLTNLQGGYWKVGSIESYGAGGGLTLSFQPKQSEYSKELVWLDF